MGMIPRPVRSSLGMKYLMALTGLGLIGFVLVHMAGNMLVFAGRDALNSYAENLKSHPGVLWTARAGLLTIFLAHVYLGLQLAVDNRRARPVRYVYEDTVKASWASRHMLSTGLVLLAFIVYHLAHFTFGAVVQAEVNGVPQNYLELRDPQDPAKGRHDVYGMVISGFRNPWITGSYVLAMVFLWLHLWHGGSSWFQSLGINHPKWNWLLRLVGPVLATVVLIGNCAMPLSILTGLIH